MDEEAAQYDDSTLVESTPKDGKCWVSEFIVWHEAMLKFPGHLPDTIHMYSIFIEDASKWN